MVLRLTVQYPVRRGPLIDGLVKAKGGSKLFGRGGGEAGTNPTPDEAAVPAE